jgi:hypothetical protein
MTAYVSFLFRTWFENKYPGVSISQWESPAIAQTATNWQNSVPVIFQHTITLSALNQIRPGLPFTHSMYWLIDVFWCTVCLLITSAPEIERYLLGFQEKYGLADSIQLNSRVISAIWHEERGEYDVEVETPEGMSKDTCHVLINATGVLNKWKCRRQTPPILQSQISFSGPKIPGLHSFKGHLLHSAHWDQSVEYKGKRVVVLGTGHKISVLRYSIVINNHYCPYRSCRTCNQMCLR